MAENFRDTLNEQLKNPAFKKEWDALEPERQIMKAVLSGRMKRNLTQAELSAITGINQSNLSRIENGNGNPSVSTLSRIASGMGMKLKIEFVPQEN